VAKLPFKISQSGTQGEINTDEACEHVRFSNKETALNPKNSRTGNKEVWDLIQKYCTTETLSAPLNNNEFIAPPQEAKPSGTGDSAESQGVNKIPPATEVKKEQQEITPPPTEEPQRPPAGDPHPVISGEKPKEQTNAGDPVDIFNGSFYLNETDLIIPNTIMPLSFTRTYSSGFAAFGPLGWNWDHNFNVYIRELNSGDIALWRNLHEEIFKFDGANFEPQSGVFEKLVKLTAISQIYELLAEGGIVLHFERPAGWIDAERIPLVWIKDRNGNQLIFSYGTEDKLSEVRDDDDRYFRFEYDECGLLVAVSDHAQRKFIYEHDEQTMQLISVKSPGISDFPGGITRIYYYEEPWELPEIRHNIIRVEDSCGNVYVENTYNKDPGSFEFSRVAEQLYGGYLYQFRYTQLQWVPADSVYINIPSVLVEVMNPDFAVETYTFNYRGDLLDRRYRLSKDKSYRVVVWKYEFDSQGNLSKSTRPDGSDEIHTYDFANSDPRMRNKLLQKEITSASGFPGPSRIVWKGKYDTIYQQLIEEKNETNTETLYKYDFDLTPAALSNTGKLMEIIEPEVTLPDGNIQKAKTSFEYNVKGQITAIIAADLSRTEFEYGISGNEKSRVIKILHDATVLKIEQKYKYDSAGFNIEITDGNSYTTSQVYNSLGLVEKRILPAVNGVVSEYRFHYDADKKIISTEKPKGSLIDSTMSGTHIIDKYERDILGNPIKYTLSSNSAESRVFRVCNDYRGIPLETMNPDESKIIRTLDERALVIGEAVIGFDGEKITSKHVYDRACKLMQATNPFGLTTKFEYDGFARLVKVILPNGTEIRNKWMKNDLLESEETIGNNGLGNVRQLAFKSFFYDEKNRRIKETIKSFVDDPAFSTLITNTYFYDKLDRIEKIVNNRGGVFTLQYDGMGRITKEIDTMGNQVQYFYDNNGNLTKSDSHNKEPDGSVSVITKQFRYDERNRRTELIEPDGSKIISEYDERNMLVKQIDHLGNIKEIHFNSFNDKISETYDPGGLGITHKWVLDDMSRVKEYIDPAGEISVYGFDSIGRNNFVDYPNGFSSRKIINGNSQIIEEKLGSGAEFVYVYDNANRIIEIKNTAFPAAAKKVDTHKFTYDGLDRLISAEAGTNKTLRKYDSLNRLLSEKVFGKSISCSYNDSTGEVEKKWPDGRTEKLSHDLNGVLNKIEQTATGSLGGGNSLLATFKTSGANAFGEATYRGGTLIKNIYDERKRLTEISIMSPAGTNEEIKYRYNKAGIKQVEALLGQNTSISYFDFDNKLRLLTAKNGFNVNIPIAKNQSEHDNAINLVKTAASGALITESFQYDSSDSRKKYSQTGAPDKNYSFFPGHRIKNDGLNNYTYFSEGVLQSDSSLNFESDSLGRIVKIKTSLGITTEIIYDALGKPSIIKETGKPDRSFNYLGGFIEQESENGIPSRQISLHPCTGIPIAYHSSLGIHYTVFDNRFNLIGLLNDNGDLIETYRYKPFGAPQIYDSLGNKLSKSAYKTEPVFGGQKYLQETGLYLSKKRLMNPVNGVFISSDPKGYADSASLYVYAAQNPVNNIDPNGDVLPIIAAFVIIGALGGAGFSLYDASEHPEKYKGWGALKALPNTFAGAVIGGLSVLGGEIVLAAGGTGALAASGTAAAAGTASTLTAGQVFLLYGTSSVVSGGILRGGFNQLFPEYVDPITLKSATIDFVSGGAIGTGLRALTNFAMSPGFGQFSFLPGMGRFGQWLRFGSDSGGSAPIQNALGPYPTRLGQLLDRIGIRQGYSSTVINNDIGNHIFARIDTAVHEGFHALVAKYLPRFRDLSDFGRYEGIARYPEEVVAYALGRAASGRLPAVLIAPFEAFRSLNVYGQAGINAAKAFWGRMATTGGVALAEQIEIPDINHPNEKPPTAK
jgi:RHS repeat-associated protein